MAAGRGRGRFLARSWPLWLLGTVCAAVSAPLWKNPGAIVHHDLYRAYDWLEAAKHASFTRDGLLAQGGFALWNPFLEGGFPSYAHPTDGSFSLSLLPILLFGEALGMKLNVVFLLLVGALGSYALAREWLGLDRAAALVTGLMVAVCGWIPGGVAVGFYESSFMALLPGFMALVLRASRVVDRRASLLWIGAAAALLAVGAVQMQLCLAFAVLQLALWAALAARQAARALWLALVSCAGLGAVKFLPMIELVVDRGWRNHDYADPASWWSMLVRPTLGLFSMTPERTGYDARGIPLALEYDHAGMSLIAGLLALLAFVCCRRRALPLAALLVITALMGWESGEGWNFSLLGLVHWLPGFSAIRESYRYSSYFMGLWLALSAGLGFAWLLERARLRGGMLARPAVPLLLIGLALLPQGLASASLFGSVFAERADGRLAEPTVFVDALGRAVSPPDEALNGFHTILALDSPAPGRKGYNLAPYLAARSNVGVMYPAEDLPPERPPAIQPLYTWTRADQALLNRDWKGEVWLERGQGRAHSLRMGPNEIGFELDVGGPALVLINQNYHRDWSLDAGPAGLLVTEHDGLLALEVPASHTGALRLRFRSRALFLGLLVSLLTLAGWLVALRRVGNPALKPAA